MQKLNDNLYIHKILESVPDALLIVNPQGEIVFFNKQTTKLFGYKEDELLGKTVDCLIPKSLRKKYIEERHKYNKHPKMRRMGSNLGLYGLKKNGKKFPVDLMLDPLTTNEGKFIFAAIRDMTLQKKFEINLERLAHHDSLTHLMNRVSFEERLENVITGWRKNDKAIAVVFIDLDNFKDINDKYGHKEGDIVLKEIAQQLKKCMRRSDLIARIGGDEFVMALEDIHNDEDAICVAKKIINHFKTHFLTKRNKIKISLSLGITRYQNGDQVNNLLRRSDIAMYLAKKSGKGRYQLN
ncbi:MAG: hypothetical protein A3F18_02080 [Legionellales bacterium RIFCSPHIGHO2_12_FULL_37_14]|nr:MAG: hypothetical protein A3F18_02080 [Legionellales bacterium RIFCSPHIGHO2_12_FULL_37_14]